MLTLLLVMILIFIGLPLGLTTLQECASLDVTAVGWKGLDEASLQKLENAVSKLDLELWLQREDLGTVLPVLAREGYTSREALYSMELEKSLQVHTNVH